MVKHKFGIMMDAPRFGKRYDKCEPWKYACISVDDAYLEGIVERLSSVDFYWHTLSVKARGFHFVESLLFRQAKGQACAMGLSEFTT